MIGRILAELRDNRGLTQDQVADDLGVKRARYNAWENNISRPDIEMLKKLAKYFHVTADYLLNEIGEPDPGITLAANKTDGYDDYLTREEQTAVRAFIETYRKTIKKRSKDE